MSTLTTEIIKTLEPLKRIITITDKLGLYLKVQPIGEKFFFFKYKLGKKTHHIKIGEFPFMSLNEAKIYRDKCIAILFMGIDLDEETILNNKTYVDTAKKEYLKDNLAFWKGVKDGGEMVSRYQEQLNKIECYEKLLGEDDEILSFPCKCNSEAT